jgi:hypothetical protein
VPRLEAKMTFFSSEVIGRGIDAFADMADATIV